jgi:hypothetical protein
MCGVIVSRLSTRTKPFVRNRHARLTRA